MVLFYFLILKDYFGSVDIRMFKYVENFNKNLFEPNTGYTWKQDFKRLRKMLQTVCSFFHALKDQEETGAAGLS